MTVQEKHDWDVLIEVIQRSYHIKKHLDFFRWQQDYLSSIFPHDVLIAVWGDFSKRVLSYDVCSKISGVRTQSLRESPGQINHIMSDLYQRWLSNSERWYRINNFSVDHSNVGLPEFNNKLSVINSILVYGLRDIRGNNDCLYVFMSKEYEFPLSTPSLGMLMPHLDAALRRVENPECDIDDELSEYHVQGLSDREHEIVHWVRLGKTNHEISIILSISPNTVKNHLKRIFSKLDVSSRAQAVATYVPPKLN